VPVYHWIHRRGRDFFQFFDTTDTRLPVRFDAEVERRPALQITYTEFDRAPQSPNIFVIPAAILGVCNNVNNKQQ
jgi:hypothetical protein